MEAIRTSNGKRPDAGTRISILENNVSHLSTTLDKLETKIDNNYATLHSRISDLRDDLRQDFESKNDKVIQKIEEHSESSNQHNKELKERIDQIERWRWMIMGAALVVGYFLAHVKLEQFF